MQSSRLGYQLAQIAADPLTAGVMSFTYGTGSHLSGGTLLFSNVEGTRLVAYEATVPEPPSLLLVGYGLVIFGAILLAANRRSSPGLEPAVAFF